jgi:hypothetical protein
MMLNQIASRKTTPPPTQVLLLPDFNLFHIDDFEDHGQPNLPPDVEQSDPFVILSQFFTDKIIEQLVE